MSDTTAFNEAVLKHHNQLRAKHGVAALTLEAELCQVAQAHAHEMAKKESMAHSDTNYGENLYMMKSSKPVDDATLAETMVQSWYSEVQKHPFGKEPRGLGTSHFSQVVWKDTAELGVGHAVAKSGAHYAACIYNPAGNFVGKYAQNVMAARQ